MNETNTTPEGGLAENEKALTKIKVPEIFSQEEIQERDCFVPSNDGATEGAENPETQLVLLHTDPKKAQMLKALIKSLGIVSYAAQEAGLRRRTHYHWMETDEVYKTAVESLNEVVLDFTEGRLFKYIQTNDLKAITFLLRYRGKGRGYSLFKEKESEMQKLIINYFLKDKATMEMVQRTKENL